MDNPRPLPFATDLLGLRGLERDAARLAAGFFDDGIRRSVGASTLHFCFKLSAPRPPHSASYPPNPLAMSR